MKRSILTIVTALGLSACAVQPRSGPPAPIEGSGAARQQVQRPAPVPAPPAEETVETYGYRTPGSEEDTGPASETPAPGAQSPSMNALPTERATSPAAGMPPPSEAVSGAPSASPPQTVAYRPSAVPSPALPPAADSLANQAEGQRQMGDFVGAAATLERALRIQPQDAYLWNRLARVRMEQGMYAQAGNLAARSNALAGSQSQLKQDNWGIIAGARRASGDADGALEAERKAGGG